MCLLQAKMIIKDNKWKDLTGCLKLNIYFHNKSLYKDHTRTHTCLHGNLELHQNKRQGFDLVKLFKPPSSITAERPKAVPPVLLCSYVDFSLRKHAYSNTLKISPPKTENFQIKNSGIFHISAQNIDCGYSLEPPRRGGSNEYTQSMFSSRNKKDNVYPCKPQFYYIKVGFEGVKIL